LSMLFGIMAPFSVVSVLLYYVEDHSDADDPTTFVALGSSGGILLSVFLLVPFGKLMDRSRDPLIMYICYELPFLAMGLPIITWTSSATAIAVLMALTGIGIQFLTAMMVPIAMVTLAHANHPQNLNRDVMAFVSIPFGLSTSTGPAISYLLGQFKEDVATVPGERPHYTVLGYRVAVSALPLVELLLSGLLMVCARYVAHKLARMQKMQAQRGASEKARDKGCKSLM